MRAEYNLAGAPPAGSQPEQSTQRRNVMSMYRVLVVALFAIAAIVLVPDRAHAAGTLECKMKFSLTSWSAIFKHSEGSGVVTCSNGKSMRVKIVGIGQRG